MSLALIDIVLIVFVVISILIGIYRGLVKEILSLGAWALAALAAYRFGVQASAYVKPYIAEPNLALIVAYVAVFLIALIALSIISFMISKLFSASGMSGIDRSLGSVFGALRAAVIIGILILVAHFLTLDSQPWWQESQLIAYFEPVADWIKSYLPESIVQKIDHAA